MMKQISNLKLLFSFILILSVSLAIAQRPKVENLPKFDRKKIHFGFTIGLNKYDFAVKPVKNLNLLDSVFVVEPFPEYGFNIGIVSDLRLGEYWNLRFIPDLSFGDRSIHYTLKSDTSKVTRIKKVESTIVEFPISLKYKSMRLNNGRAYLLGGFKVGIDMASQAKKKDVNDQLVKIKRFDYAYEMGFGLDFYFKYFKFSPELKFSMGLNNLIQKENTVFANSVDKLHSKVLLLSFMFE